MCEADCNGWPDAAKRRVLFMNPVSSWLACVATVLSAKGGRRFSRIIRVSTGTTLSPCRPISVLLHVEPWSSERVLREHNGLDFCQAMANVPKIYSDGPDAESISTSILVDTLTLVWQIYNSPPGIMQHVA